MLTGQLPSRSRSETIRVLLAHAPDAVAAVVLRALETWFDMKYRAIDDLRRDCQHALVAADSPPLRRSSAMEELSWRRKHGWIEPPPGMRQRLVIAISRAEALAWSPDGRWLAVAESAALHVLQLETGQISKISCTRISSMSWLPDSNEILVICPEGVMTIDVERQTCDNFTIENLDTSEHITRIACSPDGLHIAIAISTAEDERTKLWILDRRTMYAAVRLSCGRRINDLAWSPQGLLLAVGMHGALAAVVDTRMGRVAQLLELAAPLNEARESKLPPRPGIHPSSDGRRTQAYSQRVTPTLLRSSGLRETGRFSRSWIPHAHKVLRLQPLALYSLRSPTPCCRSGDTISLTPWRRCPFRSMRLR
jgi:hypothetical protein